MLLGFWRKFIESLLKVIPFPNMKYFSVAIKWIASHKRVSKSTSKFICKIISFKLFGVKFALS